MRHRLVGAAVLAALWMCTGCAASDDLGDAADGLSGGVPVGGLDAPADPDVDPGADADVPDDRGDVPPECLAALPYLLGPADFADMDAPAGWPDAPADATLCMTASGDVASATFVTELPFTDVAAHYERALAETVHADTYEVYRTSGEENGTGYDALDGIGPEGVMFQVREHDAGFVLVLDRT
ncbi:hypothetical protein [Microbacterium sp. No. 7]|uniref:hypothetical protein n=1 Tax=Microbacterium sp. No. 7 TaxID=1714373 RepID=UPI0006D012C4|nr:hypothetical protein [Microbacterium sp. No. 7]ALJ19224.1 hypothetical protein AOA12_04640 [Microbacterium sp. No. 7]